jgi:hypothetical protein
VRGCAVWGEMRQRIRCLGCSKPGWAADSCLYATILNNIGVLQTHALFAATFRRTMDLQFRVLTAKVQNASRVQAAKVWLGPVVCVCVVCVCVCVC